MIFSCDRLRDFDPVTHKVRSSLLDLSYGVSYMVLNNLFISVVGLNIHSI